jgi:Flp pilus assembly protein TadB
MNISILPIDFNTARRASNFLSYWSRSLIKTFPRLQVQLSQLGEEVTALEYMNIAIFSAMIYFLLAFSMIYLLSVISQAPYFRVLTVALLSSTIAAVFAFTYILTYPKVLLERRMRSMNRDLPYALRHLLVQVSSGVSLYDSVASVADSDYGEVSKQFTIVITETQGGTDFITALEDSAMKNPYSIYRDSIWELSNAAKTGADISVMLKELVLRVTDEQMIEIKEYGSHLNFLSLLYMLLTISIPTIGVVFAMMVLMFLGTSLDPSIFVLLIIFLIVVQYLFVGIIQSRRPVVVI